MKLPPCLVFLNSQKNATSDAAASDNGDDLEEDDDDFEKLKWFQKKAVQTTLLEELVSAGPTLRIPGSRQRRSKISTLLFYISLIFGL